MSPSFSLPCFARLPVFVAPFPAFSLGEAARIVKVRLTAVFRGRSTISEWRKKRPENDSYWRRRCFLISFFFFFLDEEFYFPREYFYYSTIFLLFFLSKIYLILFNLLNIFFLWRLSINLYFLLLYTIIHI